MPADDDDAESSYVSDCALPFVPFLTPMKKKCEPTITMNVKEDVNDNIAEEGDVHTYPKQSSLVKLFHIPPPPKKSIPSKLPSSKVLTSVDHLHMVEEKERSKREKEKQKEERRLKRELKKNSAKAPSKHAIIASNTLMPSSKLETKSAKCIAGRRPMVVSDEHSGKL